MENLPPELLLHILSVGDIRLPDLKNLRLVGNRRISSFITPHIFTCLTVTFTEGGLRKLGHLLGFDEENDTSLLKAAEQLYSSYYPTAGPPNELLQSRIENISQDDHIPSMVKTLRLRAVPRYDIWAKDEFWAYLLPPGRTYGSGIIDQFWEHYCETVTKQQEEDAAYGKLRRGSYGIAVLLLALAGALPCLNAVDIRWETKYEMESWTKKLRNRDERCSTSVREGWAVMYHGLEQRRKMIAWQKERDRDLFGEEEEKENCIKPITTFHLGDVDMLGQYELFQHENKGGEKEQDIGGSDSVAVRHHWRWTGFERFFNTLQLDMLTTFSVGLCPWHYASEGFAIPTFNYGRWVVSKERPSSSSDGSGSCSSTEVPLVAPWSVPIRAMRNLKHLNLASSKSMPYGSTQPYATDGGHRFGSQVLHPVFNTSPPSFSEWSGFLRPVGTGCYLRDADFDDGQRSEKFFDINYPELKISIAPGISTVGKEHERYWQDLVEENLENTPNNVTTSLTLLKTSFHWENLETISLSSFSVPVGILKAFFTTHKNTLRNVLLHNMYFITPSFLGLEQLCERYDISLMHEWRSRSDLSSYRNALLEIWDLQITHYEKIDTVISLIPHIASLPRRNLVSISSCSWGVGYAFQQINAVIHSMDGFWFAMLVEQLLGTTDERILRLKNKTRDVLFRYDEWYRDRVPDDVEDDDTADARQILAEIYKKHKRNREIIMRIFSSQKEGNVVPDL